MLRLVRVAAAAARARELVVPAALLLVAACTSGDGGVATGGGQDPDPATIDFKIAYVKRPLPEEGMLETDVRRLERFEPGGDLFVRDNASPSAAERNVTGEITQGA